MSVKKEMRSLIKNIKRIKTGLIVFIFLVFVINIIFVNQALTASKTEVIENPALKESCGIDIALVLDNSNSIDSRELAQMKQAFIQFVDSLSQSSIPTQFSVTKFGTEASIQQSFTSDTSTSLVKASINRISTGGGGTNWKKGIEKARTTFDPRTDMPDLMIFASDGNPTYPSCGGSNTCQKDVDAATTQANIVKKAGIRILALGIGNQLNINNLKAISGSKLNQPNIINSDVVTTDFANMGTKLSELASAMCPVSCTMSSNPLTLISGEASTLSWSANFSIPSDQNSFTINGLNKALTGQESTGSLLTTTTYTGVATTINGKKATCPTTISVKAKPACDIQPKNAVIKKGKSKILKWTSTNTDSITATNPINWTKKTTPSDSQEVSPTKTTTYTLQAKGAGGTSTCSASVLVKDHPNNNPPEIFLDYPANGATISVNDTNSLVLKAHGTDPENDRIIVDIQYYPTEICWSPEGSRRDPSCIEQSGWSSPYAVNASQSLTPRNRPLAIGAYHWLALVTDGLNKPVTKTGVFMVAEDPPLVAPKPFCSVAPTKGKAPLAVKATAGLNRGNPPLVGPTAYGYDFNFNKNPVMKKAAGIDKTSAYNTYSTAGVYDVYCQIIVNGQAVKADGSLIGNLDDPSAWIRGGTVKVSPTGGTSGGEVAP